jgi:hypothetical protein
MPFDRKASICRYVILPRHGSYTFKEFIKTVCSGFADNNQDPLSGSDIYICFRYIADTTGKQNPPVFRFDFVMF